MFRGLKLPESDLCRLEGDVRRSVDRSIGKSVWEMRGIVPAANYLLAPARASQSLGLTGAYMYVQMRPDPAHHFVVHVDVHTTTPNLFLRLSFSNLFREKKVCSYL